MWFFCRYFFSVAHRLMGVNPIYILLTVYIARVQWPHCELAGKWCAFFFNTLYDRTFVSVVWKFIRYSEFAGVARFFIWRRWRSPTVHDNRSIFLLFLLFLLFFFISSVESFRSCMYIYINHIMYISAWRTDFFPYFLLLLFIFSFQRTR